MLRAGLLLVALALCLLGAQADFVNPVYTAHLNGYQLQPILADTSSLGLATCFLYRYSAPIYVECYVQTTFSYLATSPITGISVWLGSVGTTGVQLYTFTGFTTTSNTQVLFFNLTTLPYSAVQEQAVVAETGFSFFEYSQFVDNNSEFDISEQIDTFLYGLWYIQINTAAYPAGAIRGQLTHSDRFYLLMTPQQVVPYLNTSAADTSTAFGLGTATYTYNSPRRTLTLSIIHTVVDPTGIDFRAGDPGQNGPFVFALSDYVSPIFEAVQITVDEQQLLFGEWLYATLYSYANPDGDIRSQTYAIDYLPRATFTARLDGDQVVPPRQTGARGCAIVTYNCTTNLLEYLLVHNVQQPLQALLYSGKPGIIGNNQFALSSAQSPIYGAYFLSSLEEYLLYNGSLYFNVQSLPYPQGEIRGQINADYPYYAYLSGINANPPVSTAGAGCATFRLLSSSSIVHLDYDIIFAASRPITTALYEGAADTNGPLNRVLSNVPHYQYVTTGNDQLLSTRDITLFTSERLYIQVNSLTYPQGELRGQIQQIFSTPCGQTYNSSADTGLVVFPPPPVLPVFGGSQLLVPSALLALLLLALLL